MKQVLLIDDSNVFRDYLKSKLATKHIEVTVGVGPLDSLSKMRNLVPELIILDFSLNRKAVYDLFEQKKLDPNARDIPVILLAQAMDKEEMASLSGFGIKKIIPKPLKIDQLFTAITDILHVEFEIDNTPCILEARVNDNILFIEIAQGLNREKIDLLKYKIQELIALYNLTYPKVLVMMTDLSLSFIDGPNLELLMDSILSNTGVKNKNVKILTLDTFARDFIEGDKKLRRDTGRQGSFPRDRLAPEGREHQQRPAGDQRENSEHARRSGLAGLHPRNALQVGTGIPEVRCKGYPHRGHRR